MGALVVYQTRRGYGNALKVGMNYAVNNLNTKAIVFMDADRTYDPKDVPLLIQPIFDGKADLVTGNRLLPMNGRSMPRINRIGNMLISLVLRASFGLKVKDACSGMKALRSDLVKKLSLEVDDWPLMTEILAKAWWLKAKVEEIPITYHVRLGRSKLPRFGSALDNIEVILKNRVTKKSYLWSAS
jgi:glycosyltransferase involved in cell wall biosynthesis